MKRIFSFLIIALFFPMYALAGPPCLAPQYLYPAHLLKTGQTTSYHADDDGDLEFGIACSYTVLTTGQYSGATNITINGKTEATSNACVQDNKTDLMFHRAVIQTNIGPAADGKFFWEQYTLGPKIDISFTAATKIINSVAGDFDTGACCVGRKITVSGAGQAGNNQVVTVVAITANNMTVNEVIVNEGAGASVSFATVDDLVWDLVDQANANSLAGYTDWRIPNQKELASILDDENCSPAIDGTIFPSTPSSQHWTSTTYACGVTYAWQILFSSGVISYAGKKPIKYYVRLVR